MAPQAPHADAARSRRAGERATDMTPTTDMGTAGPVLAVVKDLFFVARIRETARLAGVSLAFARSVTELAETAAGPAPRFVLLDLTGGFDYAAIFGAAEARGLPVLGFTTHALAGQTKPWHARCARVVTKETLTAELPSLLQKGIGA